MKTKHILSISSAILALIIVAFFAFLYSGKTSPSKEKIIRTLDLPVAWIGFKPILSSQLFQRFDQALRYKGNSGDLGIAEKNTIYLRLLEDSASKNLASSLGVSVSKEDLENEYQRLIYEQSKGDQESFVKLLNDYYQLKPDDFKEKVLYFEILRAKIASSYYGSSRYNSNSLESLSKIETRLKNGEDFESLAKSVSEDTTSNKLGGNLGYIPETQLLPEFRIALKDAKANSLIKTSSRYGLHLIFISDITNSDNGKLFGLKQIYIAGKGFEQWEASQINGQKILRLISY